jgi:Domain of unknown function (DUF4419)
MGTFAVDDVELAATPVKTRPLRECYSSQLCIGGDPELLVVDTTWDEAEVLPQAEHLATVHPLIGAVSLAFSQHRPLVLSPDAIWLTIAQGVAQHVRDNAERLRPRVVRHAGNKPIVLSVISVPETAEQWATAIDGLRERLAKEIGDGRATLFECNFSTSTPTDRLASQVVLLDAYSPYFRYEMRFICGIPSVTLTGTPADWREIEKRLDVLEELDLHDWCSRLRPIIREMIASAEGTPNIALWKRIYNPKDAYGGDHVTGWITRLYPYVGEQRKPNPMLKFEMDEPKEVTGLFAKLVSMIKKPPDLPGVPLSSFPNTLSRISVRISDGREVETPVSDRRVSLFAGLVAIAVDERGAVRPISGWHVNATVPVIEVAAIIRERYQSAPPTKSDSDRPKFPMTRDVVSVPRELDELWTHLGETTMFEGDHEWRIRDRKHLLAIEPPGRRWQAGAIADLPGGKSLCYWIDIEATRWFVCTLSTQEDKTRIVEPTDQVLTHGTSITRLLDTALATGGDISELAGPSIATLGYS